MGYLGSANATNARRGHPMANSEYNMPRRTSMSGTFYGDQSQGAATSMMRYRVH